MAELTDLKDKIKKFYSFTKNEIIGLVITILAFAFIISFKDWGPGDAFDPAIGIFNLFNALLIVALSILINDAGKRIWALAIGYKIEYRMSVFGLVIAVIAAFATKGALWVLIPGTFIVHMLPGHRLGWFRYDINYFGQAMVAFGGMLATLTLIIFFKAIGALYQNALIDKAIIFNIIFLIISLIPFPTFDGGKIIFASRMSYAFLMPAIMFAAIMMIVDIPVYLSLILSLLVGVVLWLVYYIAFERQIWKGPQ